MKTQNKEKGFTLVELLLVIAIIGILATVLFVSLGKQRKRARMTTFKENMRGLVTAATACHDAGGEITMNDDAAANADGVAMDGTKEVCNPTNEIGKVPEQQACIGGTKKAKIKVEEGNGDDWKFVGCCQLSSNETCSFDDLVSPTDCIATCTVDGCTYTNCE